MDVLIVIALFISSQFTHELANRSRKASATLARALLLVGWASTVAGCFLGWTALGLDSSALRYVYDSLVIAVVSLTASRL
jgi:hypothetical protein